MQIVVTKKIDESFQPVPRPGRSDWLSQHHEKGQTMKSFEQNSSKAIPHGT